MAKNKSGKKENPILVGILMLIVAAVLIAGAGSYVWVLFGVLELPLWVPGVLAGILGVFQLIVGIKEKTGK